MNKLELKEAIAEYLHRDDITTTLYNTFIEFATRRIGLALQSYENEKVVQLMPTSHLVDLPTDFSSLRSITYPNGNSVISLASVPLDVLYRYPLEGASPSIYAITQKKIDIRPFQDNITFDLTYYHYPEFLVDDTDTNSILTAYPYLYLYAGLVEANRWTQDAEQLSIALNNYVNEMQIVNRESEKARTGNMPQMRGV